MLLSCFSVTGCKKDTTTAAAKGLEDEKKATLTYMVSGALTDSDKAAIAAMKKDYGKDVDTVVCQYGEEQSKIVQSIAANNAIDVVSAGVNNFPLYAKQNWTLPLEDYVDLDSDAMAKSVMDRMFSYNGKVYCAAPLKSVAPYVLYYNKDLFAQEGLPDPMTYYDEGKWNWDTFKKICAIFTKDTDNDGVIDRWGYAGWYRDCFYGLNKCAPVKLDDQGNYVLNLDDPAVTHSLEMMRDMWYVNKYAGIDGDDIYQSFYEGKNVFINEYSWAEDKIIDAKNKGEFDFDYGVIPCPYGPDNNDQSNLVFASGYAMINGTDCPKTSGKFIEELVAAANADATAKEADKPADSVALYDKMRSGNMYTDRYYDNCIDYGSDLNYKVCDGADIQSAINEFKPQFQRKLDEANQPPETPIINDFTPINLTFDTDDQSLVVNPQKASVSGLAVKWLSNGFGDGTNGGAYQIQVTPDTNDGDPIDAAITGSNVTVLPWHKYKISFDYKVDQGAENGKYSIGILDTKKKKYEMKPFTAAKNGDVEHFETDYDSISTNTDSLVFLFSCENAYSITIDNFQVVENTGDTTATTAAQ